MAFEGIDTKHLERIADALEALLALQVQNQKHYYRIVDSLDNIENAIIARA